jgi:hypothetical protein
MDDFAVAVYVNFFQVVIHTVGFGRDHDFAFLDLLRKAGSEEGSFSFADPNENIDSLSGKMNQLLTVIQAASSVPIEVRCLGAEKPEPAIRLLAGSDGEYWVDLTDCKEDAIHTLEVSLRRNGGEFVPDQVQAVAEELDDDSQLRALYHGHLIDQLAAEILDLSKLAAVPAASASAQPVLPKDVMLHIELALMRGRRLLSSVNPQGADVARLTDLMKMLADVKAGHSVDHVKLTDMKFQGRYTGQQQQQQQAPQHAPIGHKFMCGFLPTQSIVAERVPRGQWSVHANVSRFMTDSDKPEVFRRLLQDSNATLLPWLEEQKAVWPSQLTSNKVTAFLAAASIGRVVAVKAMAAHLPNLDVRDSQNLNALDLAILHGYTGGSDARSSTVERHKKLRAAGVEILHGRTTFGYWKTYDALRTLGLRPTIDGTLLLRTSLSHGFYDIAERLVRVTLKASLGASLGGTLTYALASACLVSPFHPASHVIGCSSSPDI